jgi:hypothetical protein
MFASLLLSCPWLNQATASAVLGGAITQAGCNFVGNMEMHFELLQEFKPRCGTAEIIKGVGNEALACPGEVMFRLRDKVFLVRINTNDRDKIRKVAELIAGSMF